MRSESRSSGLHENTVLVATSSEPVSQDTTRRCDAHSSAFTDTPSRAAVARSGSSCPVNDTWCLRMIGAPDRSGAISRARVAVRAAQNSRCPSSRTASSSSAT